MKANSLLFLFFVLMGTSTAQKPITHAYRINEKITIDANLEEPAWEKAERITDFIQTAPNPSEPATQKTDVKLLFDDEAIYVGAWLWDTKASEILTELGQRDDLSIAADLFAVMFDTYDDDQNGFGLAVTSSGVQSDVKFSSSLGDDISWNAVYESKVKVTDEGWFVEMKIPYFALRFPEKDIQTWGFNAHRIIKKTREESNWSYIDPNVRGFVNQFGTLEGLNNLKPPLRLSFTPFLSSNFATYGSSDVASTFNAGMDLKYGLNDSFTLDMTLVPDFGGVASDEQILNLGPFEQVFDENRDFFNEGTELFQRYGLFYSRRIGQTPVNYFDVENDLQDHEIISTNPSRAKLINGTKVSGRTTSNFGLGFFNAITNKAVATIVDTITNETRDFETDPLTNYNILVAEKALKNASSVFIMNTNVTRGGDNRNANVTATGVKLRDSKNKYQLNYNYALSQIFETNDTGDREDTRGFRTSFSLSEIEAPWTFGIGSNLESDKYDPNDLGLLFSNNELDSWFNVGFTKNQETSWYRTLNLNLNARRSQLYKPNTFTGTNLRFNAFRVSPKLFASWIGSSYSPKGTKDFFEPRVYDFKTYYQRPSRIYMWAGISTDYSKKLAIDVELSRGTGNDSIKVDSWELRVGPRVRISDQLFFTFSHNINTRDGDVGYATTIDSTAVFGVRDRVSNNTSFELKYRFNENMNVNFVSRYGWDKVDYSTFKPLVNDGKLGPNYVFSSPDEIPDNLNFSAFNFDASFRWRFAPGSDITAVYKKQIGVLSYLLEENYFTNFSDLLQDDHGDSFNLKLVYFLDYNKLRSKFKSQKIGTS